MAFPYALAGLLLVASASVPEAAVVRQSVRRALDAGRPLEAAQLLWSYAKDRPHWPHAAEWVDHAARLAAGAGESTRAIGWLDALADRVPAGPEGHRLRMRAALLLFEAHRPADAALRFERLAATELPLDARWELDLVRARCDVALAAVDRTSAPALRRAARDKLERAWRGLFTVGDRISPGA